MLKEYCDCSDDRIVIGKKRPTIMVVDAFEKPDKTHTPKKLKRKGFTILMKTIVFGPPGTGKDTYIVGEGR